MKTVRILVLLLVPLAPVLQGGCGRAQAGKNQLAACQNIEVSSAEEAGGAPVGVFSATRTIDLTFTVKFKKGFAGDHVLELHVLTPDGNLYRRLVTPITADVTRGPRAVPLAGHRRPVVQRKLRHLTRGTGGPLAVDVPLPVAGTDILSAGLYGTWRVEARLDGGRTACNLATAFTLTE